MKTENFFNKSKEKLIKKPLISLNQTKIQLKNIKIQKSQKLYKLQFELEVKNKWNEFLLERKKFEKTSIFFQVVIF